MISYSALVQVEGLAGGTSRVLGPVTDGHCAVPDSPQLALELQGLAIHALVVLKTKRHTFIDRSNEKQTFLVSHGNVLIEYKTREIITIICIRVRLSKND